LRLQTAFFSTVIFVAACATEPPPEQLSAEESEVLTGAVEDTVETLSAIGTTDFGINAAVFRGLRCATVETDRRTFLTVTLDCKRPFDITGTVHFERSSPEQLISITDLIVRRTSIDSATTLVVPNDPTQPRTFDGALIVSGPRRVLDAVVSASWVVSGRCVILNADVFVSRNSVERALTITDRRICRRF
jgi:hypothetical protein